MSDSLEMVKVAEAVLVDKKAEDVKVIDIQDMPALANYFIIANGSSPNQMQAMMGNMEKEFGKTRYEYHQIEGYGSAGWILMNYDDIIVHAFSEEDRLFYDLERTWRDGKLVEEGEL